MSEPEVLDGSADQAGSWLDELAGELASADRAYAERVLRAHLHAIRDGVDLDTAAGIGGGLPQLIRGLYYESWSPAPAHRPYRGLSEFLARIEADADLAGAEEASEACAAASRVLARHLPADRLEEAIAQLPPELAPMLGAPAAAPAAAAGATTGFSRVVCGIDYSPEAIEALRQAQVLADADARLVGVAVWDPAAAAHGAHPSSQLVEFVRNQAAASLLAAQERVPRLQTRLVRGKDVAALLETASAERADLVAVGSHARSRPVGIALGSVATAVAHRAACSVLIARRTDRFHRIPDRILLAADGSADSRLAATAAGRIAARYDSTLIALHVDDATQGTEVVEEAVALIEATGVEPVVEVRSGRPHRCIAEVAERTAASLIVLGSRGLGGVRALGSVSERVAHQAPCSVLIVRGPTPADPDSPAR